MNLYEIMFIQNPDIGEEDQTKLLTKFTTTITKNGGEIIKIDDQGIRGLAYKIQKYSRGRYFLGYVEGPGSMIPEIERFLRIEENVVRFVVIKLDSHVTKEELLPKPVVEPEPVKDAEPAKEAEPVAETKTEEAGE